MNLPLLFVTVSAVFLIQVTTILCMLEDSRDLTDVTFKSPSTLKQSFGTDKATLREKATTENPSQDALPVHTTGVSDRVNAPGDKEDNSKPLMGESHGDTVLPRVQTMERPGAHIKQEIPKQSADIEKSEAATLQVSNLPQVYYDNQRITSSKLKHKTKNGFKKREKERMNNRITNIYQLKGVDGDMGSVKFEKKVVKPETGKKEINWFIRIRQIVDDNVLEDGNNRETGVKKDQKMVGSAENEKDNTKDSKITEREKDKMKVNEMRQHRRRLMVYSAKDNSDIVNVQKDLGKKRKEAAVDEFDSGDEVESDVPITTNPDSENVVSFEKNDLKERPESEDLNSEQTERRKLESVDTPFILRQYPQIENAEPKQLELPTNINSEKKRDNLLDEVVERLQNAYNMDFIRRRGGEKKAQNYDDKDKDGANDGTMINELLKEGERDQKLVQRYQGMKIKKRSVQDVSGNYGVSVDDSDDESGPKEYDFETENGEKEMRFPRETKQRRARRESGKKQTTRPSSEAQGNSHIEGNQVESNSNSNVEARGSEALKNRDKMKQHQSGDISMNTNDEPRIIEVGLIVLNKDGMGKSLAKAILTNAVQHDNSQDSDNTNPILQRNSPNHHRRPCNSSHGGKMGGGLGNSSGHLNSGRSMHPCHHDHRRHHRNRARNTEQHSTGRNENHQIDSYNSDKHHTTQQQNNPHSDTHIGNEHLILNNGREKQDHETHPHESHHTESHFPEHHNEHEQVTESSRIKTDHAHERGEIMVESFERVSGVSGSHTHHNSHAGNAVHVLVILSIFVICFTAIMFIILRNRFPRSGSLHTDGISPLMQTLARCLGGRRL